MKPQITEAELSRMTREVDELHHDTRPLFRAELSQFAEELGEKLDTIRQATHIDATRRNFLRGGLVTAGALGAGLVVAACGSDSSSSTSSSSAASSSTSSGLSGDLLVAQLAASLEILAVNTYDAALQLAQGGKIGTVPPVFGKFAVTVKSHHKDHGDAWNGALTKNGQQAVTTPNPKGQKIVDAAVPGLKTVVDVANLALVLEQAAVATYTKGVSLLSDKANRGVGLSIAPVEAQHVAILYFVLGKYPVPDTFAQTTQALDTSSLQG